MDSSLKNSNKFSCIILYEIHKEHCQISADQLKNNKRQYKVWVYSGKSILFEERFFLNPLAKVTAGFAKDVEEVS